MRASEVQRRSQSHTAWAIQPADAPCGLTKECGRRRHRTLPPTRRVHGWVALLMSASMVCQGVGTVAMGDVILALEPNSRSKVQAADDIASQFPWIVEVNNENQQGHSCKPESIELSDMPAKLNTKAEMSLNELKFVDDIRSNNTQFHCWTTGYSKFKQIPHNLTSLLRSKLSGLVGEYWWQDCLQQKLCHFCVSVNQRRAPACFGVACPVTLKWTLLLCKKCLVGCRPLPPHFISLYRRCKLCKRFATFGPANGHRMSAAHCKEHKHDDEVDVVCRKCNFPGCARRALFGPPKFVDGFKGLNPDGNNANRKLIVIPERCSFHRKVGDTNSPKKICQYKGCYQYATQGNRNWNGGARRYCAQHKPMDFHDINSKRCKFPLGCDRLANYGNPLEGLPRFCGAHRSWGDVHLKKRICNHCKCWSTAVFSIRSVPAKYFCKKHWRSKVPFKRQQEDQVLQRNSRTPLPRPNTPDSHQTELTGPVSRFDNSVLCLSPVTPCESGLSP